MAVVESLKTALQNFDKDQEQLKKWFNDSLSQTYKEQFHPGNEATEIVKNLVDRIVDKRDARITELAIEYFFKMLYFEGPISVQLGLKFLDNKDFSVQVSKSVSTIGQALLANMRRFYGNQSKDLVDELSSLFLSQTNEIGDQQLIPHPDMTLIHPLHLSTFIQIESIRLERIQEQLRKAEEEQAKNGNSISTLQQNLTQKQAAEDRLLKKVSELENKVSLLEKKIADFNPTPPEVDFSKSVIEKEELKTAEFDKYTLIKIFLKDKDGKYIPGSLRFLQVFVKSYQNTIELEVERKEESGVGEVKYLPHTTGPHVLQVLYKGGALDESPFFIPGQLLAQSVPYVPFGLAVFRNFLYVSFCEKSLTNSISVFDLSREGSEHPLPPSRDIKNFNNPRGLSTSPSGELLIAETMLNQVVVQSAGDLRTAIGGKTDPSLLGKMFEPRSAIFLPAGRILICDSNNSRLLVFVRDDLKRLLANQWEIKVVGIPGAGDLEFRNPLSVAFDPLRREIAIADTDNNRVQFMDLDHFQFRGCLPGTFAKPNAVTYDKFGNLYVAELDGKKVSVYCGKTKALIRVLFQPQDFKGKPRGIAISTNGRVYVTDHEEKRILSS